MLPLTFIFLLTFHELRGDDCSNSTELPFLSQRLAGYKLAPGESAFSDDYMPEGWYRMPGFRISSRASEKCGVNINWYLKDGKLPDPGKTISTNACINNGSPCVGTSAKSVLIKQCAPADYAFYLFSTDGSDEGYCIVSINGTLGGLDAPDIGYIAPVIDIRIKKLDDQRRELEYLCLFTEKPVDRDLLFTVEWAITDTSAKARYLSSGTATKRSNTAYEDATKLTERHLSAQGIYKLGFEIMCTVKAQTSKVGRYSSPMQSQRKFCGIKIHSASPLLVHNTDHAVISLELTVPFMCPNDVKSCFLDVNLQIPDQNDCQIGSIGHVNKKVPCGVRFTTSEINTLKNITISTKIGDSATSPNDLTFNALLRTHTFPAQDMLSQYWLEPVRVYVIVESNKLSSARCYAYSDPHTKTFDRPGTFENQVSGIFLLYRNRAFNTEIHTKHGRCPNYNPSTDKPYCNKAVAIRAGRDVYIIDLEERITSFKLCDDAVLSHKIRTKSAGREFEIFLPTGANVKVRSTWYNFLEIDIMPGLHDYQKTDGLCGRFDSDASNDVDKPPDCHESHNLCWKLEDAKSLFDAEYRLSLARWNEELNLCSCSCNYSAGCKFSDIVTCDSSHMKSCKMNNYNEVHNGMCLTDRRKRDIHRHDEIEPDFAFDSEHFQTYKGRYRRALTVLDLATARRQCADEMNTTSVQMCTGLPGLDIAPYIENCALDAMASNTMEWTPIHIRGIQETCLKIVEFNQPIPAEVLARANVTVLNTTTNMTHTTFGTPSASFTFTPELLKRVKEVTCLDDCSNNGQCVNGTCRCNKGFIGEDCAIDADAAPIMIGIPDKGLCDLSERPCAQTAVIGHNFVDSPQLSCRVVPFQINLNNTRYNHSSIKVAANLDTFLQVFCPLPKISRRQRSSVTQPNDIVASGYKVAVSNNGKAFSGEDTIVIFETQCVDCTKLNGTITCSKKLEFCIHDGRCYKPGEKLDCFSCIKEATSANWSPGDNCAVPELIDDPRRELWIIGATVGPVAVVVIVITVVVCVFTKKKATIKEYNGVEQVSAQ